MRRDLVRIRSSLGTSQDVFCPDVRLDSLEPGYYVAYTFGHPYTHTVLSQDGTPVGWCWSDHFSVGFFQKAPPVAVSAISPEWVLSQLAGMSFPAQGEAYDYMKKVFANIPSPNG